MISDVLSEASSQIQRYLEDVSNYDDPDFQRRIKTVLDIMELARLHLDYPIGDHSKTDEFLDEIRIRVKKLIKHSSKPKMKAKR